MHRRHAKTTIPASAGIVGVLLRGAIQTGRATGAALACLRTISIASSIDCS